MVDQKLQADLRARFNPDGSILRRHQLRMLEMLKYIDKICRENNIEYWLSSGTCLGAVRHGGFIPWDDDVDIEMLKPDYLEFERAMREEANGDFVLQTHKSDGEYFAPYGKVRDLKSIIEEGNCHDRYYKYRGVYIDVFVIEPSVSRCLSRLSGGMQSRLQYPLSRIRNKALRRLATNSMYVLLSKCVYPVFSLITCCKSSSKLRHIHGSGFVKPRYKKDLFPLKQIIFEEYSFPAPNNCRNYLSELYGDYMSIPEMSKIHTHLSNVTLY